MAGPVKWFVCLVGYGVGWKGCKPMREARACCSCHRQRMSQEAFRHFICLFRSNSTLYLSSCRTVSCVLCPGSRDPESRSWVRPSRSFPQPVSAIVTSRPVHVVPENPAFFSKSLPNFVRKSVSAMFFSLKIKFWWKEEVR